MSKYILTRELYDFFGKLGDFLKKLQKFSANSAISSQLQQFPSKVMISEDNSTISISLNLLQSIANKIGYITESLFLWVY